MGWFSRSRKQPGQPGQPGQPEPTPKVAGLLGYYGLVDWWLTAFSAAEHEEIEAMWGYITFQGHPITDDRPLTRGHVTSNPLSAAEFLMAMHHRVTDKKTSAKVLAKVRELRGGDVPGFINGKAYMVYMNQAKKLLQNGRVEEADPIVDKALRGLEDKERIGPFLTELSVVPPAPYWDFAVPYRKLKDYAREVAVLERFTRQPHLTGGASGKNLERLEKARRLLANSADHAAAEDIDDVDEEAE